MKISHTQLDSCRKNPRSWIQEQASPSFGPRFGYNQALTNAIHRFHKSGDAEGVHRFLELSIERHFKDETRSAQIVEWLDSYIGWCRQSRVLVSDSRFNIRLSCGVWLELSGQIHRLDTVNSGYRAILLGDYPVNWRNQLRMPLLQRAIASRYERPEGEIEMGVQQLDGSGIDIQKYTSQEINAAKTEFKQLSSTLQLYARNYPSLLGL
jgi:hypothetical protein